ncbi:flavin-containing monooxygenase [Scheffersomyces coipomensis]|uniref:flavin-containing monooxygenase n=1 Tax=Scheffersomyces coipomensis TaxID=1788519 RepID=UPI00315D71FD
MTKLDIESIAIIGAGPGGIASLYEFLHTNKDGTSTVGQAVSTNPKFTKVVAFEQKDTAGGIWSAPPSFDKTDLAIPPQEILDTEKYNDASVIHPPAKVPEGLEGTSFEKPLELKENKLSSDLEWKASGIFPDLFSNIPSRYMRFSYIKNEPEYLDRSRTIYPFIHHQEQTGRFEKFIKDEKLYDNIRVNSTVERVTKTPNGKWIVTVRQKDPIHNKEYWYNEQFDGVVISNGHYTLPNIPRIEGLSQFNKNFPGVLNHVKNYRNQHDYKDKKVLIVGGSISTINSLQYIVPVAKHVVNSKRGKHLVFPWINDALVSKGIDSRGTIERIDPVTGEFFFKEGASEKGFDEVLFTTGYHFNYPFLDQNHEGVKVINPSNSSRVSGLYYNTFSIDDPTLATVGVTLSTLNFHTIESSAASIAGVWSGSKTLPSKQEQQKWEEDHLHDTKNNISFHYYTHRQAKAGIIDPLFQYAPEGRYNPLEFDEPYLSDVETGIQSIERLFYGLKDGTIPKSKTLLQS